MSNQDDYGKLSDWLLWSAVREQGKYREQALVSAEARRKRFKEAQEQEQSEQAPVEQEQAPVEQEQSAEGKRRAAIDARRKRVEQRQVDRRSKRPHAIVPRRAKDEGAALAVESMFTVRRVIRIRANSDGRKYFRQFLDAFKARALNLEREDNDISLPPDDYANYVADRQNAETSRAVKVASKVREWPQFVRFAVDGSPQAIAFLRTRLRSPFNPTGWVEEIFSDVPIALPRIGSGQSPKP